MAATIITTAQGAVSVDVERAMEVSVAVAVEPSGLFVGVSFSITEEDYRVSFDGTRTTYFSKSVSTLDEALAYAANNAILRASFQIAS